MDIRHINLVLWHMKGCSRQVKQKKSLTYPKSKNTNIAFIEERHYDNEEEAPKLKLYWFGNVFHYLISSKS